LCAALAGGAAPAGFADTYLYQMSGYPWISGRSPGAVCDAWAKWAEWAQARTYPNAQCPISITITDSAGGVCSFTDTLVTLFPPCITGASFVPYALQTVLRLVSKNQGAPEPENGCPVGNPVNPANGNKYQKETDYAGSGLFPLRLERYYNRGNHSLVRAFGARWSSNYHAMLHDFTFSGSRVVTAIRPDGKWLEFRPAGSAWTSDPDVRDVLEEERDGSGVQTGWRLTLKADDVVERYDLAGNLVSISDRAGNAHTLSYDASGRLASVSDTVGRQIGFAYDGYGRVSSVTLPGGLGIAYTYGENVPSVKMVQYPDGRVRTYLYASDSFTQLTGIVDENGEQYVSWSYDSSGRVTLAQNAGGTNAVQLDYSAGTAVTDSFGVTRSYGFVTQFGTQKNASIAGAPSSSCGPPSRTFAGNGYPDSTTDWNGNRTNFVFDARGRETQRVEGLSAAGAPTPQTRTIGTQWHPVWRLPAAMSEPLRRTTWVYNGDGGANCGTKPDGTTLVPGVPCSKSVQATADADGSQGFAAPALGSPRVWTYTYNPNGQVLTVDGPRADVADVTTYTYHPNDDPDPGKRGNLATVTNALGHVTAITAYNAHGQPTSITDPNGLVITLGYDARQRLTSREVGGETTSYEYDGVGQLIKVTLPDGSFLAYAYDAAHRLIGMSDNLGNRIAYTLDHAGNRTREEVFDPGNSLAQTRSRVYSNLNRLFQEIGAVGQTTEYAYDAQGNVISVKDPLSRVTAQQYDALNRLQQVTDPANGVTRYGYNGLDALTSVTDPRSLVTGYAVDGLGNLVQQSSPDTGTTVNTYDAAGNLLTQTDAKGQVTTYAYDALNRVNLIAFGDGSRQAYAYDQGANALGRLSSITETDAANALTGEIRYAYDLHGRVTSETRILNGVSYAVGYSYDGAGRLSAMSYPSGRTLGYGFDALGRVNKVTTAKDGPSQVVVQNVQYHPFGGVKSFTLGNGQSYSRGYDQDGRIASYSLGAQLYAIGYDAASRIVFISETGNAANSNTYDYDALDRLTSAVLPSTPFAYSYDAVGNRLSKTVGAATETYGYSASSNRIATLTPATGPVRSFVFDPNGSTLADGLNSYAYDARGRMVQATSALGPSAYQVNALGQRVRKTTPASNSVFHYDTRGRLIAETDPGGGLKREFIYLGDILVGVVQ
jgi:YD repeat-containing protein